MAKMEEKGALLEGARDPSIERASQGLRRPASSHITHLASRPATRQSIQIGNGPT